MVHMGQRQQAPLLSTCSVPGPEHHEYHFTNIVQLDPHKDPSFHREGNYSIHQVQLAQDNTTNDKQNRFTPRSA